MPDIGIRVSGAIAPQRCVELAGAAEDAGFTSIWFAENPLQRGIMATAGACATATRRLRIGVGVINPYSRHPAQIAMDFAALDELSGGRAVLGLGSGIAAAVQRMGVDAGRPVAAVQEAIGIIRALLAGDEVTMHGRVFDVAGLRPAFGVPRQIPIYMAAASERALRVCGQIADGLVVSNMTPSRSTARMTAIVAEAAGRAGRPMPRIVQYVPCVVGTDSEAARREIKTAIGEALTMLWPAGDDWPRRRETAVAESGIPRRDVAAALERLRCRENAADALDDRFVTAFGIAGTADECLQQAAAYRAAGADELALTFAGSQPELGIASLGRCLCP